MFVTEGANRAQSSERPLRALAPASASPYDFVRLKEEVLSTAAQCGRNKAAICGRPDPKSSKRQSCLRAVTVGCGRPDHTYGSTRALPAL
eukprot:5060503-Prymnesium_polylepis.3